MRFVFPILTLAFANSAFASDWKVVESRTESAEPFAEKIAEKLAARLNMEKSKTVFLTVSSCNPPIELADAWCTSFKSALTSSLVARGITFLPESSAKSVREAIANEHVYQSSTGMVDESKAVELGKQQAFQAFVSVVVSGEDATKFQAVKVESANKKSQSFNAKILVNVTSINIAKGVTTVNERQTGTFKQEFATSTTAKILGWSGVAAGVGVAGYLHFMAYKSNTEGDKFYRQYKDENDPAKIKDLKAKAKKKDEDVARYNTLAGVGWGVALLSGVGMWFSGESVLSYNLADTGASHRLNIQPVFMRTASGLSFSLEF